MSKPPGVKHLINAQRLTMAAALAAAAYGLAFPPGELVLESSLLGPLQSLAHPLGTDALGNDVIALFFWGGLLTLALAVPLRVVTLLLVVAMVFSELLRPSLRTLWDGMANVFLSVPSVLLALILSVLIPESYLGLGLAVVASEWAYAYLTLSGRAKSVDGESFIAAAKLLGGGRRHAIGYHFIPWLRPFIRDLFIAGLSTTILTISIVSFLGFGPGDFYGVTDWGSQIATAKNYLLDFPILTLLPSAGIFGAVLYLNRFR